jgi:triacylglycerol lipase
MIENYIKLANVCIKSYRQHHRNGEFSVPNDYKEVVGFKAKVFEANEWFGFILENEKEIIVAFRGTVSQTDWLADALAFQREFPYADDCGKVHYGFLEIYDSCREEIFRALARLDNRKRVVITGHSLGAALATLFALDVVKNSEFSNVELINFASPRVGNRKFCKAVNKELQRVTRIVNVHDVVTLFPPFVIPFPWIKNKGVFLHVKGKYKLNLLKDTFFGNHNIGTYITGLKLQKRDKKTT